MYGSVRAGKYLELERDFVGVLYLSLFKDVKLVGMIHLIAVTRAKITVLLASLRAETVFNVIVLTLLFTASPPRTTLITLMSSNNLTPKDVSLQ